MSKMYWPRSGWKQRTGISFILVAGFVIVAGAVVFMGAAAVSAAAAAVVAESVGAVHAAIGVTVTVAS